MKANFRLALPKIYPITDRTLTGLSHTDQVRELIAGGATLIQLREKSLEAGEWLEDGQTAVSLAKQAGVKILINDRVDIAMVLKADGVHLGQTDLPVEAARRLLGSEAIIGYSTHTIEQVKRATLLSVDYIAFGPVFPTQTKAGNAVVGLKMLAGVRHLIGAIPLVAIGGIGEDELRDVLLAGADAAAMIGAILNDPLVISQRMRALLDAGC